MTQMSMFAQADPAPSDSVREWFVLVTYQDGTQNRSRSYRDRADAVSCESRVHQQKLTMPDINIIELREVTP